MERATRKFTLDDVGKSIVAHEQRETEKLAAVSNEIDEIRKIVNELYKVLITGNGEPSIREQVRMNNTWIATANRLGLIIFVAVVGEVLTTGCALIYAVVKLLSNHTLLP